MLVSIVAFIPRIIPKISAVADNAVRALAERRARRMSLQSKRDAIAGGRDVELLAQADVFAATNKAHGGKADLVERKSAIGGGVRTKRNPNVV